MSDMHRSPQLILASGSPRRRELLRAAGIRFEVRVPNVDEGRQCGEPAEAMVERLACDKVAAIAVEVFPDACVLAADTVVVLAERVIGKPRDEAEAIEMLLTLSSQTHRVLTGYALRSPRRTKPRSGFSESLVSFREISHAEAVAYVRTGEPMDKAGAYAVQGSAAKFIDSISGSRSNVIGLPMETILPLLSNSGIRPA